MSRQTPRPGDVVGRQSPVGKETALRATGREEVWAPALLAQASAIVFVISLGLLHVLKPDLDPSWHFISEYAIGPHGWLMTAAFLSLAVGCLSLCLALRRDATGVWFRIGLALLLVSGAGLVIGALFVTDGINTAPEAATTSGAMHNLGGTLGIALPIGIGILTWRLRRSPRWMRERRVIGWTGLLAVAAGIVTMMAVPMMLAGNDGQFGPETPVGWLNRLEVVTAAAWIFVVGARHERLERSDAGSTASKHAADIRPS